MEGSIGHRDSNTHAAAASKERPSSLLTWLISWRYLYALLSAMAASCDTGAEPAVQYQYSISECAVTDTDSRFYRRIDVEKHGDC